MINEIEKEKKIKAKGKQLDIVFNLKGVNLVVCIFFVGLAIGWFFRSLF